MLRLPGFLEVEPLDVSGDVLLYSAVREADETRVIAIVPKEHYPGPEIADAWQAEYELLQHLDGAGALAPLALLTVGRRPVLLAEHFGGTTLRQLIDRPSDNGHRSSVRRHGLVAAVAVAAGIADCLEQAHRLNVPHGAIEPSRILVDPETWQARLVHFRLPAPGAAAGRESVVRSADGNALAYLSPEQTGRLSREVDYRTDFYSLGIVLYEWFAGVPPFAAKGAAEMIYAHIAKRAEPAHERETAVPAVLSAIVRKCMEKAPEDRYVSAYGIRADLEACQRQLRQTGTIVSFPLARQDKPERWQLPQKLYGRQREQRELLDAYARCAAGAAEAAMVSGFAGIGKTSFVRETLQSAAVGGFFIAGDFEPFGHDVPYSALRQALGELTRLLLIGDETQLEMWRLRILDIVGAYGGLLIELVPQLEWLIGKQPQVPPLPPAEAQNRFHELLSRFLLAFAGREHPLVLFIDNLQWADKASLQALARLMTDGRAEGILLVGAFRETENGPANRLRELFGYPDTRFGITTIALGPLDRAAIGRLLADAMRIPAGQTDELAQALLRKTGGNPFLLKQLATDLFGSGRLAFDYDGRGWQWDMDDVEALAVHEDAADYLLHKIRGLPEASVAALRWASFQGSRFDASSVAEASGLSETAVEEALCNAAAEGLLQRIGPDPSAYVFTHERIRQAAFSLVPDEDRAYVHYRIGRLLAERLAEDDSRLFETVNHLNRASALITDSDELLRLAELNVQAGLRAKQSAAYETALHYLRLGVGLLGEDAWTARYAYMYRIYKARAECEFLCANYETAQELFRLLLELARTDLDKAAVYCSMIQLESNKDNYATVFELSERTLDLLGVTKRFSASKLGLTRQLLRLRRKIRGRSPQELSGLPPMRDERRQMAMAAISYMCSSGFNVDRTLWASASLTMLEMTLDYGIVPESGGAFVNLALLLTFRLNDFRQAYEWGKVGCEMTRPYPTLYAKSYTAFMLCQDSWRAQDPDLLDRFFRYADNVGLETGDLWQTNQCQLISWALQFYYGRPLQPIAEQMVRAESAFKRNENKVQQAQADLLANWIMLLTGESAPGGANALPDIFSERFTEPSPDDCDGLLQDMACTVGFISAYLFDRYEQGLKIAHLSEQVYKRKRRDAFERSGNYMYEALIMGALYEEASEHRRRRFRNRTRHCAHMLAVYVKRCSVNYLHKYLLVAAEYARMRGRPQEAAELYERACAEARGNGFMHNTAVIQEAAARFYLGRGRTDMAALCMREAHHWYLWWGAKAKASRLRAEYPLLVGGGAEASAATGIDYAAVMKSVQAISGEMVMDRLLETLLRNLLHNSGAERGAILFDHAGEWRIEAFGSGEEIALKPVALDETDRVPAPIIDYVARSMEDVVLRNAASEGMFAFHAQIRAKALKSVLCLPVVHQSKPIAIVYLENNLAAGVFTPDRLDVLKLLCAQCAISIDNARLYTGMQRLKISLEEQVLERTRTMERAATETAEALAELAIYEERNRIAAEIHDIVGHSLTSTILQIEAGKRLLRKNREGALEKLDDSQQLIRHSLQEIRRSVHMLKEGARFNLGHALTKLIRDTEQHAGISVHTAISTLPELPDAHKKALYHAVQEGLTNGIRHGDSKRFRLVLMCDDTAVHFRLEDDGKGADTLVWGFGLKSMKQRVEELNGTLRVEVAPGQGCLLRIQLPYRLPDERKAGG